MAETPRAVGTETVKKFGPRTLLVGALIVAALLLWQGAHQAQISALKDLTATGEERLNLYADTIRAALEKYHYLPFVISENRAIRNLLDGQGRLDQVNSYLQEVNAKAGSAALFIMNAQGLTLASSNWQDPTNSFVGRNYGFRPYFKDALAGRRGGFFAIGVTTGRPGYFMSHLVRSRSGENLGVAVVKVDLGPLQQDWREAGEVVFVSDPNDVVFLSSHPPWLYRSLRPLSEETMAKIRAQRQYSGVRLQSLGQTSEAKAGHRLMEKSGVQWLAQERTISDLGWRLHYLSELALVHDRRNTTLISLGLAMVLTSGLLLFFRERRQTREARRFRQLSKRLTREVSERKKTEQTLRDTQDELIQAGKLAALGQMSAAIAHELNQPITAIRTFLASTHLLLAKGAVEPASNAVAEVDSLAQRMAAITGQLKTFARKSSGERAPVNLTEAVEAALALMERQLRDANCRIVTSFDEESPWVMADTVRIEQVMINLLRNSLDAMGGMERSEIHIEITREDDNALIRVMDRGHGMAPDALEHLFDPFFTTKEVGEGVGLGLSISYGIVCDLGGSIRAANQSDGGARFTVRLPLMEKDS